MPPQKDSKKKYQKRSYRKYSKPLAKSNASASLTRNYNILNTVKPAIYKFTDTFQLNNIVGTGVSVVGLSNVKIGDLARYSALTSMFRKYRINAIKLNFRLRTIELTDQAEHPHLLLRWNYDPSLLSSSITENFMLRQQNVLSKQFIHNTPDGCSLQYTLKPAVMFQTQNYNGTTVQAPKFKQWIDFTGTSTTEVDHYGIQYWLSSLPSGQTIDIDCSVYYECKDLI